MLNYLIPVLFVVADVIGIAYEMKRAPEINSEDETEYLRNGSKPTNEIDKPEIF